MFSNAATGSSPVVAGDGTGSGVGERRAGDARSGRTGSSRCGSDADAEPVAPARANDVAVSRRGSDADAESTTAGLEGGVDPSAGGRAADVASAPAYLAHAYDATTILLRAIADVAVADGDTLFIDRARLREALTSTTGFGGITGAISCDEFGDCGTGRLRISHHTDSNVTDIAELPVVYRFAP